MRVAQCLAGGRNSALLVLGPTVPIFPGPRRLVIALGTTSLSCSVSMSGLMSFTWPKEHYYSFGYSLFLSVLLHYYF